MTLIDVMLSLQETESGLQTYVNIKGLILVGTRYIHINIKKFPSKLIITCSKFESTNCRIYSYMDYVLTLAGLAISLACSVLSLIF